MAQYFTSDFADFTAVSGADYTDWTSRYNTSGTWTKTSGDIESPSSGTNDWTALTWDDLDGDSGRVDIDILILWRSTNFSQRRYPIIVRGSGADESATLYAVACFSNNLRIYVCNGSDTPSLVATNNLSFSFATDTDYYIRLRINGSAIKAKCWDATGGASAEPGGVATDASWDVSTTDSTITVAGWNGLGHYSAASNVCLWKQIGVGTNGDWGPSSAASGTAVNPGVGSLAITGYAPTVAQSANQALVPGVGSLAITGYAPTVSQSAAQNITPDTGTLGITGYAPSVAQSANQEILPNVGSLTFTGYAPTVAQSVNQTVDPNTGAITITGYAPDVAQSAAGNVAPDTGTIAIVGYAPTVAQTANQEILPAVGPVVITGYAPTVSQGNNQEVVPGVGSISFTGYAPDVSQSNNASLVPGAGSIVITGYAPDVVQSAGSDLFPGAGTVVITGYAPSVIRTTGGAGGLSAEDVWLYELETGFSAKDLMRLMSAVLLGKTTVTDTGGGTAVVTFEAVDGSKIRVQATMDGSERTSLTYDTTE